MASLMLSTCLVVQVFQRYVCVWGEGGGELVATAGGTAAVQTVAFIDETGLGSSQENDD